MHVAVGMACVWGGMPLCSEVIEPQKPQDEDPTHLTLHGLPLQTITIECLWERGLRQPATVQCSILAYKTDNEL